MKTLKAELTKKNIINSAMVLFNDVGFNKTTMRMIADKSNCSLGLIYRYFETKEDIVLEIYNQIMCKFENSLSELPKGTLYERFEFLIRKKLELIKGLKKTLWVIFSASFDPEHSIGVFDKTTKDIRQRGVNTFYILVEGSDNVSKSEKKQKKLSRILYLLHLFIILLWFLDKTENNKMTEEFIKLCKELFFILNLPLSDIFTKRLENIIDITLD